MKGSMIKNAISIGVLTCLIVLNGSCGNQDLADLLQDLTDGKRPVLEDNQVKDAEGQIQFDVVEADCARNKAAKWCAADALWFDGSGSENDKNSKTLIYYLDNGVTRGVVFKLCRNTGKPKAKIVYYEDGLTERQRDVYYENTGNLKAQITYNVDGTESRRTCYNNYINGRSKPCHSLGPSVRPSVDVAGKARPPEGAGGKRSSGHRTPAPGAIVGPVRLKITYWEDGLTKKCETIYWRNGNKKARICYRNDGVTARFKYIYDWNGNGKAYVRYGRNGLTKHFEYTYWQNGNRKTTVWYSPRRLKTTNWKNGNQKTWILYHKNGVTKRLERCYYEDNGNKEMEIAYSTDGTEARRTCYRMDGSLRACRLALGTQGPPIDNSEAPKGPSGNGDDADDTTGGNTDNAGDDADDTTGDNTDNAGDDADDTTGDDTDNAGDDADDTTGDDTDDAGDDADDDTDDAGDDADDNTDDTGGDSDSDEVVCSSPPIDTDRDSVCDALDIDDDNNGLIEIHNLDMLSHIHYNLAGTSYKNSANAAGITRGAPTSATANCSTAVDGTYLCGYELSRNLDFAQGASYADGRVNTNWCRVVSNLCSTNTGYGGFPGLGSATNGGSAFTAIFDGNYRTIRNLYMRNLSSFGQQVALFRLVGSPGKIRNIKLIKARVYGGEGKHDSVGGLVGRNYGVIAKSNSILGVAHGGAGNYDRVGGLVGRNNGSIKESYAVATVKGGIGVSEVVGGLVGHNTNKIIASYAGSIVDGNGKIGGLVGENDSAMIVASYAKGLVTGSGGRDCVGGLVGNNKSYGGQSTGSVASIRVSYAASSVNGAGGNDLVGGLVGCNYVASITASYATGSVSGDGGKDDVGGLIGFHYGNNVIMTASYALGKVSGGGGNKDSVGSLIGSKWYGSVTASYGFGSTTEGERRGDDGTAKPSGVRTASDLSAATAGPVWNQASNHTAGAWLFGSHPPKLRYANYDGTTYYCSMFPSNVICGTTEIPGQMFNIDTDGDGIYDAVDVDDDNDGLIEIHNLDMLRHVHYNLMGTSYKNNANAAGITTGAPTSATANCDTAVNGIYLCGYELTRNLNFADVASYANRAIHNDWRPNNSDPSNATNAGFPGLGAATGNSGGFAAIFDGNGHSISHLYMRSIETSAQSVGLFRRTESGATIRNLGLINSHIYGGSNGSRVGGLVGHNYGRIIASYTKGSVHGGEGDTGFRRGENLPASVFKTLTAVGGLVGKHEGTITASYSASTVSDGEGTSVLGGLVGYSENGSIRATYVTGDVRGGGRSDFIGVFGGVNDGSILVANYANNECTGQGILVGGFFAYYIPGGNRIDNYRFNPGMGSVAPDGVESASGLSATNVGGSWNDATRHTLGAWVFGDHPPLLRYADYDGSGVTGYCDMFPSDITCGATLLPGQTVPE